MSRTFAKFKSSCPSSDFTQWKKIQSIYCNQSCCPNIYLDRYSMQSSKRIHNPSSIIDHSQLYINLFTKLNLNNDIPVVGNLKNNNSYPTPIDTSNNEVSYLAYNIDPSGILFGNNVCGLDNFESFLVYDSC